MMEIPIVIHKDKDSVYGVTVPDIPGCFSWGDTVEGAIRNTRQAILGHIEALLSEGMAVDISPSQIETLNVNKDYANAYLWALVDVDISKRSAGTRGVELDWNLPDPLPLRRANNYGKTTRPRQCRRV